MERKEAYIIEKALNEWTFEVLNSVSSDGGVLPPYKFSVDKIEEPGIYESEEEARKALNDYAKEKGITLAKTEVKRLKK